MKCPLRKTTYKMYCVHTGHDKLEEEFADCIEGKCGWYDNKCCSLLRISKSLDDISIELPCHD